MKRTLLSLVIVGLVAVPAAAVETQVGTVVTADESTLVVSTADGRTTIDYAQLETPPSDLQEGDAVVVRYDGDEPSEILLIDDKVEVAGATSDIYRAIVGTVEQVNTEHLILTTPTGQEAFVIYPDKLFPPFPEPNSRIALIYRETGTTSKYSQYAASEIIELDDSFQIASNNVEVSYSDIEEPAQDERIEQDETQVAKAEASVTVHREIESDELDETDAAARADVRTERTLPQTASPLPLVGLLGLLAALGWLALGARR